MYNGIKIISPAVNQIGGKEMLLNSIAENLRKTRNEIKENAKYFSPEWEKEQLRSLKAQAKELYQKGFEEYQNISNDYENKISKLENSFYIGHSISPEYVEKVNYMKSRILAEIRINPNGKDKVINQSLSTKVGSQALLELIQNKELDNSYWTDDTFKKAFINSKSQAELDFEINKDNQIKALKKEYAEQCNYGSYLAAQKTFYGDVKAGIPNLERLFDDEIERLENPNKSEIMFAGGKEDE